MLPRRTLTSAVLFAAPALHGASAARARIGEVTALTGTAVALFSGEAPRALAVAVPVLLEDVLSTREAARLACRLDGDVTLLLGENASVRLSSAMLQRRRLGIAVRSFGGAMLLDLPPAATRSAVPVTGVTLPWAHIGVRGTRFFAGILDGVRSVFVERGQVEVTAAGARAVLDAGEGIDIAEGASPSPATRWGEARIRRALAMVT